MMIKKMSKIKSEVIRLLREKPHLRDDDNKLIANIWNGAIGTAQTKTMTAYDFLNNFAAGNYINPESIRRIRQKIQEQIPDLRGKSYKERKKAGVKTRTAIHKL